MDVKAAKTRRTAVLRSPTNLTENATRDISGALTTLLADMFALYVKTKNFHWHVSGPHFRDYHLMLDEQAEQIFATTDDIAERVRKIGGTTLRSIGHIARLQRVLDNDADFVTPQDMLAELRDDNNDLAARMRETHELCDEHGDVASASLIENLDRRSRTPHLVPVRGHSQAILGLIYASTMFGAQEGPLVDDCSATQGDLCREAPTRPITRPSRSPASGPIDNYPVSSSLTDGSRLRDAQS